MMQIFGAMLLASLPVPLLLALHRCIFGRDELIVLNLTAAIREQRRLEPKSNVVPFRPREKFRAQQ